MSAPQTTSVSYLLWPYFLNCISNALPLISMSSFVIQKVCSPSGEPSINDFICNDQALIAEATGITISMSTIRSTLGALSILAFGYWRDKTGHNKRLLYFSEMADAVKMIFYIVAAANWSTSPWWPAFLDAVVSGIFGNEVYMMGINCIIIENSKPEERTIRLQRMGTMMFLSFFVGMFARGFLLTKIGYYYYFCMIFVLRLASILLMSILVPDVRKPAVKKKNLDLFGTLKTVFKPRLNFAVIWLMLIAKSVFNSFFQAQMSIRSYYMQQAFKLTMKDQTYQGVYALIVHTAGNILNPILFIKYLKWSDLKIGVVSSFFGVLSALMMAFAQSSAVLYISPLLETVMFNLMTVPQSVLSNIVRTDEIGLYTGFSSLLGIALPFLINNLFQSVISATSQTMPGAVYLLSAAGNILVMTFYIFSTYLYVQPEKSEKEKTEHETDGISNNDVKKTN